MIYIGCDTHKQTHTIVAIDESGKTISSKKIKNSPIAFKELLTWNILRDNNHIWGIENSQHYGKHLAQYLLENGEQAYEISPKLTAQLRGRSLKQDKSDTLDALAIAKALIQEKGNLHLVPDRNSDKECLKEITRFRDALVKKRTDLTNLLHDSLFNIDCEYKDKISDLRSKCNLEAVKNLYLVKHSSQVDQLYQEEIQMLIKLISELNSQIKKLENDYIKPIVKKIPNPLKSLGGIGDITEAVLLGEIGDISNYNNAGQLASRAGISPLENSSAKNKYRRVNPGGNRRLNSAFHTIALSQIKTKKEGYKYYIKKKMEGKTSKEAIRCLKRKLVDIVYSMLKNKKVYFKTLEMQEAA